MTDTVRVYFFTVSGDECFAKRTIRPAPEELQDSLYKRGLVLSGFDESNHGSEDEEPGDSFGQVRKGDYEI